ncbi:E1-E2 ATPase-domain-containing protein [Pyrenochaeta sp. MPI-SDFR-AT-0127]|nr:E1-E2 ATPase-domain-containing protein [Pyrenochaeta sp. MPI-SDFR-AT-0127]
MSAREPRGGEGDLPMHGEHQLRNSKNPSYPPNAAIDADPTFSSRDALIPDPGTEADFHVENNPFAFSPGQLGKLINPKSLAAFHALGGIAGLEKGLRTDIKAGLSVDECSLDGLVSFEEATTPVHDREVFTYDGTKPAATKRPSDSFADRKRVFSDNRLPYHRPKSLFQLAWTAFDDKALLLLSLGVLISLADGLNQAYESRYTEYGLKDLLRYTVDTARVPLAATAVFTLVTVFLNGLEEGHNSEAHRNKNDRMVKAIRSGRTCEISVFDILVGDVLHLEPGDLIPVDGILIEGHNLRCDESSATGESDTVRKTPGDEYFESIKRHDSLKKMDPFIISGAKVLEGIGAFMVTATGQHSSYGKTMMSLYTEYGGCKPPGPQKERTIATFGTLSAIIFMVLMNRFTTATTALLALCLALSIDLLLAIFRETVMRKLELNDLVRIRSWLTMGNATTTCSDKKSTQKRNPKLAVHKLLTQSLRRDGQIVPNDTDHEGIEELRRAIATNTTAFLADDGLSFIGSRTDCALLEYARDFLGMDINSERAKANWVACVPFDSLRASQASLVRQGDRYRLYVLGSPEALFRQTSSLIPNLSQAAPLGLASGSLRTIAIAYKDFPQLPSVFDEFDADKNAFLGSLQDLVFLAAFELRRPVVQDPQAPQGGSWPAKKTRSEDGFSRLPVVTLDAQRSLASFMRRRSAFNVRPLAWTILPTFFASANAAPTGGPAHGPNWKDRALQALTDILISLAFLLAPITILFICGVVALVLRHRRKDGSAALAMLGLALVFITIKTPPPTDAKHDNPFIVLAVGMAYGMFMLVYCELVMLNNNGGKIFCFIAVAIGSLATLILMAFAPVRTYWKDLTKLDPLFVLAFATPLSFAMCDLAIYIATLINGGEKRDEDRPESPIPASSTRTTRQLDRLHYVNIAGLRSRSLFSDFYDNDPSEIEFQNLNADLEAGRHEPASTQQSNPSRFSRLLRSFKGMFGKSKPT